MSPINEPSSLLHRPENSRLTTTKDRCVQAGKRAIFLSLDQLVIDVATRQAMWRLRSLGGSYGGRRRDFCRICTRITKGSSNGNRDGKNQIEDLFHDCS